MMEMEVEWGLVRRMAMVVHPVVVRAVLAQHNQVCRPITLNNNTIILHSFVLLH